jgi:hypothetical protein
MMRLLRLVLPAAAEPQPGIDDIRLAQAEWELDGGVKIPAVLVLRPSGRQRLRIPSGLDVDDADQQRMLEKTDAEYRLAIGGTVAEAA